MYTLRTAQLHQVVAGVPSQHKQSAEALWTSDGKRCLVVLVVRRPM